MELDFDDDTDLDDVSNPDVSDFDLKASDEEEYPQHGWQVSAFIAELAVEQAAERAAKHATRRTALAFLFNRILVPLQEQLHLPLFLPAALLLSLVIVVVAEPGSVPLSRPGPSWGSLFLPLQLILPPRHKQT